MSITIENPGILTTIQDRGRFGNRSLGVNPTGVMDQTAFRLVNILLGNFENEAALEFHFPAPQIRFESDAIIAIGGAEFAATLDGVSLQNLQSVLAKKGQILRFSEKALGNRAYLGVKGGFTTTDWLGSKSTNLKAKRGGFEGRALKKGDRIAFRSESQVDTPFRKRRVSPYFYTDYLHANRVRIIAGAEFERLTPFSSEEFFANRFFVTAQSDRMGYRLAGKALYLLDEIELVSAAVTIGTIQLLPNGQMIILMADHQTTGGYPRIGTVIEMDLPILAQLGSHDFLEFSLVTVADAERIAAKFENDLNLLKTAVKLDAFN